MTFRVGIHEAVITYPETTCNNVLKFILELEGILEAIVVFIFGWFVNKIRGLFRGNVIGNLIAVEREEIVILFKGKDDLLSIITPVNIFWSWRNINSSNENLSLPIVECDEFFTLNG